MNEDSSRQILVVQSVKNPGVAAILALLLGPLGLLYVGWKPALVMLLIGVPVVLFSFGFGLFLMAPINAFIGYKQATAFNQQLMASRG